MIHVSPPLEPADFERRTRQPGRAWLNRNLDINGRLPKGKRPPDKWSRYRNQLADGFNNLCGYSAMFNRDGTVDHYLCCENHPDLAYE